MNKQEFGEYVRGVDPNAPEPIDVFIGYDEREAVAYHVCAQSILSKASRPVRFTPLALNTLAGYVEQHTDGSNAFTYSRFLVPWLCNWQGFAIFIDGDMLLREDIAELWKLRRCDRGVAVVKHDYRTRYPTKYLGARNEDYPRKNWSSVILWNCGFFPNRKLTPNFVGAQSGAYLHRFGWLDDERIDELPPEWNHLTMEYEPNDGAKLLHYTVGTPCFDGYETQEGASEWRDQYRRAIHPMRDANGDHNLL